MREDEVIDHIEKVEVNEMVATNNPGVIAVSAIANVFDVNRHCEGVALNYYLDSVDEDATMEEVVDALNSGDRESLERFGITISSSYDHEHNAVIANHIEELHQMLLDNISYVQSQVSLNTASIANKNVVDFDLNAYCEAAALDEILSESNDDASFDEIVAALHNEDDDEIERLNIVVTERFEGEDYSTIGDMLAEYKESLFKNITFAYDKMVQAMPLSEAAIKPLLAPGHEVSEALAQRKVLEEFLGSDATGDFDEIVDAIASGDADQLEVLNIVLSDNYMHDDGEYTAKAMRRMAAIMQETLQETMQVKPSEVVINPSLLTDIRNLCQAVEDGDPQTISDRMLNVQGNLPPLSKQEVLDELCQVWTNRYAYQEGLDVEGWFQLIVEAGATPITGNSHEFSSFTWASEQEALQKLTDMSGSDRNGLFERVIDYRENNYLLVLDVVKTDTGAFETLGRDVELANVLSQAGSHVAQSNWELSGGELAPFDLRDTDSNVVGRGFILSASPMANREKLAELNANKPEQGVQVVIDVEKVLLSARNPDDNWYKPLAAEIQRVANTHLNGSQLDHGNRVENMQSVVMDHDGDGEQFEPLRFELAGVIDVNGSLVDGKLEALQLFMMQGHPRRYGKPSMVVSVDQEAKDGGRNDVPFGVFFATAEENPTSTRPLMTKTELAAYREQYDVLAFDENWSSWDQVVERFVTACDCPEP